jgi:mono/diheme cytochrome c family protein
MKRRNGALSAGIFIVAVLALAAGIAGCAAGKTSIPTAEDLHAAGALPRGADLDALRRGRAILVTECAACHRLFLPDEYSPERWRGIVKRMAGRASLAEDQAADLLRYLSAAGRAGK